MPSRTLLIDGSSTSSSNGGIVQPPVTPYHVVYMSDPNDVNRPTCHINFATGGETLSIIMGRAASVIAKFSAAPTLNILTLQLGQNDFIAGGPFANNVAGWVTDVQTLLATYRTGAASKLLKIGLTTQNPRNDATFLGTRAAVNTAIRALVTGGNADFLIDWAADPTYGQDADVTDTIKYADGKHPSQANQNNMEALYYRPALNTL
jgi:GDSL-like lipase/acylhydrolase family protein